MAAASTSSNPVGLASYRALCLRFYMEGDNGGRAAINYLEACPKPADVEGSSRGGDGASVAVNIGAAEAEVPTPPPSWVETGLGDPSSMSADDYMACVAAKNSARGDAHAMLPVTPMLCYP